MLHSWADRSGIRRFLPIPLLFLLTAMATAILGTTAAQAAGPVVTVVTATPGTPTVGQAVQINITTNRTVLDLGPTHVTISVSGPNATILGCDITSLGGSTCSAGYTGTQVGTDTILAQAGAGDSGKTTTVTWRGIPAAVSLNPLISYNTVGNNATVAALVVDRQGQAVQGAAVGFTVTGPGATTGSGSTDSSGNASFTFSSSSPGKSTIVASATGATGPVAGTATAIWAGPPSNVLLDWFGPTKSAGGLAAVNATATVVAAVTDVDGNPAGDNTSVNFTVTGVGNTTGSAATSAGKAVFAFGAAVTGTSTVTASAAPAPASNSVTVTWQTPMAKTITLAPKLTVGVIGHNQILVATVTDQFGQPFAGALVRFALQGANGVPTTSSFTTLADGKAAFLDRGVNVGIDTITSWVDLQNTDTLDIGDPVDSANIFWQLAPGQGYWLAASDGGIFNYGPATSFQGSTGAIHLNQPIVGMARTPTGFGYWLVASDGGIFAFGDAVFRGSTGSMHLNKPIVGMAATPDGGGYWLVASDGGIFAFGNAVFRGSTGAIHLNKPIVGMAATPAGGGYWLVATDGGIFAYGNAAFAGSTGSIHLNKPIVGMAAAPAGGYWLAATDGGIFNFGPGATLYGSLGSVHLNQPIVGIGAISDGSGYFMTASDGGVFNFGPGAALFGSAASGPLNKPVVAIAVAP